MNEWDRQCLRDLVSEVVDDDRELDDAGWNRVDRALELIDESVDAGTEDWHAASGSLLKLISDRASRGLNESLNEPEQPAPRQQGRPAPPETRELLNRLLHRLGPSPNETPRADDPA